VNHAKEKFDLILMRSTVTATHYSLLSPFTLESYLYTKEALKRYWDILSQDACLMISYYSELRQSAKDTMRFLQMLQLYKLVEALNLKEHTIIIRENISIGNSMLNRYVFLLFKNAIDKNSLSKFKIKGELLYFPGKIYDIKDKENDYKRIFNISFLRDDKPSLYNFIKWRKSLFYIFKLIFIICLLIIILLVLGKVNFKKTIFYLLLGIGYIALELNLVGKLVLFLGNPVYSMQVVLASFLFFGGWGGYWGITRMKINIKRYLFLLFLFNFLFIFICNWLYTLNIANQILKNALAFLLVAPVGFFSTVPFSQALFKEPKRHIMYALDGVGTVLGTILIVFIQIHGGFSLGFLFIALTYALAIYFT